VEKTSNSNADEEQVHNNHGDETVPIDQVAIILRFVPVSRKEAIVIEARVKNLVHFPEEYKGETHLRPVDPLVSLVPKFKSGISQLLIFRFRPRFIFCKLTTLNLVGCFLSEFHCTEFLRELVGVCQVDNKNDH